MGNWSIFPSFNTASVLIQLRHLPISSPTFLVSIQLLFLFNIGEVTIRKRKECFNTASVLIQRNRKRDRKLRHRVSIQLLFLFNLVTEIITMMERCFNTASVLIQPPLRFSLYSSLLFQYSFCSYSTQRN